jgi:hypothetical protein
VACIQDAHRRNVVGPDPGADSPAGRQSVTGLVRIFHGARCARREKCAEIGHPWSISLSPTVSVGPRCALTVCRLQIPTLRSGICKCIHARTSSNTAPSCNIRASTALRMGKSRSIADAKRIAGFSCGDLGAFSWMCSTTISPRGYHAPDLLCAKASLCHQITVGRMYIAHLRYAPILLPASI